MRDDTRCDAAAEAADVGVWRTARQVARAGGQRRIPRPLTAAAVPPSTNTPSTYGGSVPVNYSVIAVCTGMLVGLLAQLVFGATGTAFLAFGGAIGAYVMVATNARAFEGEPVATERRVEPVAEPGTDAIP